MGLGSWLRARRSRGGEVDEADEGAEEEGEEMSVAVLCKGITLDWEVSVVEDPDEEGPTVGVVGRSDMLAEGSFSFALPFGSVVAGPDSGGEGADDRRPRDDGSPS
jgi:hypothetical protein